LIGETNAKRRRNVQMASGMEWARSIIVVVRLGTGFELKAGV
jgi:hypothetical protein